MIACNQRVPRLTQRREPATRGPNLSLKKRLLPFNSQQFGHLLCSQSVDGSRPELKSADPEILILSVTLRKVAAVNETLGCEFAQCVWLLILNTDLLFALLSLFMSTKGNS